MAEKSYRRRALFACWSAWRRKSKLNDPLTMLQCSVEILHCSAMERP